MPKVSAAFFSLVISLAPSMVSCESKKALVLTDTHLGALELRKDLKISKALLEKKFPGFRVTQEIASGDSPDFHYFQIMDKDGEALFTISSFFEYENYAKRIIKNPTDIRIDILEVVSPRIADAHGIRVGDRVKDLIKLRGQNLRFGAGHHGVYMTAGMISYNLEVPDPGPNQPDRDPEDISKEEVIRGNWKIRSLSWPAPVW